MAREEVPLTLQKWTSISMRNRDLMRSDDDARQGWRHEDRSGLGSTDPRTFTKTDQDPAEPVNTDFLHNSCMYEGACASLPIPSQPKLLSLQLLCN